MSNTDTIRSIEHLGTLLSEPDCGLARLRRTVRNGELAAWLETRPGLSSTFRLRLSDLFQEFGEDPARGLFALRCALDPDAALEILPDCRIHGLAELVPWLSARPGRRSELFAGLRQLLDNGRLILWFRALDPRDCEVLSDVLQHTRVAFRDEPELLIHAILWHASPDEPLPFGGEAIGNPRELARRIDHSEDDRLRGLELLERGWIRTWLVASGRLADPEPLDALLGQPDLSASARLEAALHLLDPSLEWPRVRVEPSVLDFGTVREGQSTERELAISNAGRGIASGHLSIADATAEGLSLEQGDFTNLMGLQHIPIRVRVEGIRRGTRGTARIILSGFGTEQQVPVTWRVGLPLGVLGGWLVAASAALGLILVAGVLVYSAGADERNLLREMLRPGLVVSPSEQSAVGRVARELADSGLLGTGGDTTVTRTAVISSNAATATLGWSDVDGDDPNSVLIRLKKLNGQWKVVSAEHIDSSGRRVVEDYEPPFPDPYWDDVLANSG